jgi:hypothetical protein
VKQQSKLYMSKLKLLVGIVGRKQAGKDTTADILAARFKSIGYPPIRASFADSLKEEIAAATGGNVETINRNKHLPEVRKLLQWWGTDLRREQYGKTYWTDKFLQMYTDLTGPAFVYVADVRFQNEALTIRRAGGLLVRIFRQEADKVEDTHASEVELGKIVWDLSVNNDSTIQNLEWELIRYVIPAIKERYKI